MTAEDYAKKAMNIINSLFTRSKIYDGEEGYIKESFVKLFQAALDTPVVDGFVPEEDGESNDYIRICLKEETAKLVANGAEAIWLPVEPQPTGCNRISIGKEYWTPFYQDAQFRDVEYTNEFYKLPFKEGDTAYLLETWRIKSYNPEGSIYVIEYKSGGEKLIQYISKKYSLLNLKLYYGIYILIDSNKGWRSPATMPNIACRHVWTISKVEAVQAKDITFCQLESIGVKWVQKSSLSNVLMNWLNTTYPHLSMDSWGFYFEREK